MTVRGVVRIFILFRLERLVLAMVARTLRYWPRAPALRSLGWHLGHQVDPGRALLETQIRTGGNLSVNVREYAHRHTYLYGDYEVELSSLLARIASPGWVFFDVGANNGFFSVLACDLGGPASHAVAFEPNPRLIPLLRRAIPRVGGNITVIPAAVGRVRERAPLTIVDDERNSGLSTLLEVDKRTRNQVTEVDVVTLDDYARVNEVAPHVIKIDVEGAELDVLLGARRLLTEPDLRAVICEVAPERPVKDLVTLMERVGFSPYHILRGGVLRPFTGIPALENLCFMRAHDAHHLGN